MPTLRPPVLVGIDDSPGSEAALRWAIDDASARAVPVRLVYAYHWELTDARPLAYADMPEGDISAARQHAEALVTRMAEASRDFDPTVEVDGEAVDGDAARVLVQESEYASVLVLGSRHLKSIGSAVLGSVGAAVAARAACPAVVVRGPGGPIAAGAGVVVGVDGTEASETVLEFGFEHASRHKVPLRAILCWHPDPLAVLNWRAEPQAPARVEAWLSEAVAGWQEKFPDVTVYPEVVREHPVAGLVVASTEQHLLVVGTHGRHAVAGTLLGSVSQGVLHHATCPVAVVPTHRAATT